MAPMKQSKFRALLLKAKTRFAERKHASAISQQATNLILLAHDLNDQLQKAILEAQNLTALAKQLHARAHLRLATPYFKGPRTRRCRTTRSVPKLTMPSWTGTSACRSI